MFKKFSFLLTFLFLCSMMSLFAASDTGDDWLSVNKNVIVDAQGNPVRLTGVNWFGFNCNERVFHGLWCMNLDRTLQEVVADRGFNILRIPISTMLIHEWMNGEMKRIYVNESENPGFSNMTSLDMFDYTLKKCKELGIKVMVDIHHADDNNSGHIYPLWFKGDITSEIFFATLEWMADRYKNDDTIVAYDLENEPHGNPAKESVFAKWDDSFDENNWKYAAETASARILAKNPNVLILVEGIEVYPVDGENWTSKDEDNYYYNWWGGNLRAVADHPVDLGDFQHKLVYSPHDYGPVVWEQPWFEGDVDSITEERMYEECWGPNWYYLVEQQISPLLIGEWGGKIDGSHTMTTKNVKWLTLLSEFIQKKELHHTFWCLNCNSGDTGGIILDWNQGGDAKYAVDEEKYAFVEPTLWQDRDGKYVSLDHQRPLGSWATGTNITRYYEEGNRKPVPPEAGPSASIISPKNGAKILPGEPVLISAGVESLTGEVIEKIALYDGTTLLAEENGASINYSWTDAVDGAHKLTAYGYVAGGEVVESAVVSILVGNYVAVQINNPEKNRIFYVGDSVVVAADVDTNIAGDVTVGFYDADGVLLATDMSAPYEYAISEPAAGNQTITAKASITSGGKLFEDTAEVSFVIALPDLVLKYKCDNQQSPTATIQAKVKVVNLDDAAFSLDDISVRYYYTPDDLSRAQNFACYWAELGNQYVVGNFYDGEGGHYLKISFTGGKTLPSGSSDGTGIIQFCISNEGWSQVFDQTNDFSFDGTPVQDFVISDKVAIFYKGQLVWGEIPAN